MAIDYNTADSVIQTQSGFGKGGRKFSYSDFRNAVVAMRGGYDISDSPPNYT